MTAVSICCQRAPRLSAPAVDSVVRMQALGVREATVLSSLAFMPYVGAARHNEAARAVGLAAYSMRAQRCVCREDACIISWWKLLLSCLLPAERASATSAARSACMMHTACMHSAVMRTQSCAVRRHARNPSCLVSCLHDMCVHAA